MIFKLTIPFVAMVTGFGPCGDRKVSQFLFLFERICFYV